MTDLVAGIRTIDVSRSQWRAEAAACAAVGYEFFDWLSAVDQSGHQGDGTAAGLSADSEPGMAVLAHLIAVGPERPRPLARVLLRTVVPEGEAVDSLTSIFAGAAWHERETHEMFGVDFAGFDDGTPLGLRPLLLPPGFQGRPLHKSFILAARASKPWPGAKEPGESEGAPTPTGRRRKRLLPPGVPDASWGPRRQ